MSGNQLLQNLCRRLDAALSDDEISNVIEDILGFTKILCRKRKFHNSILESMKNPNSSQSLAENEYECFNKLRAKVCQKILQNASKPISLKCLQIFFNILWCHSKFCQVPLIYDKLFMKSYEMLIESVLLHGPKIVTNVFVRNVNQRLDYLVSFYHLATSSNFVGLIAETSADEFSHYVKTLLKLAPPKTQEGYDTLFEKQECNSKACLKFLSFDNLKTKFSKTWLSVLAIPMEISVETSLLFHLSNDLMPLFSDPRDLTDFLFIKLESTFLKSRYLSLDCLQTLVGKYNLEYPDLYEKVYEMCSEEAFMLNTCSDKFLQVLRRFLLSTKLSYELLVKFCLRLSERVLKSEAVTALKLMAMIDEILTTHKLLPTKEPNLRRKKPKNSEVEEICQSNYVSEDLIDTILRIKETMKTHYHAGVRHEASKLGEISTKVRLTDVLEVEDLSATMFKLAEQKVLKDEIVFVAKTEFPLS